MSPSFARTIDKNRKMNITGEIPSEIGHLTNIELVYFAQLAITGAIPTEIASLSALELLSWVDTLSKGNLPSELGRMEGLSKLRLKGNQFSGSLPFELFANLTKQQLGTYTRSYMDFSNNRISGTLPSGCWINYCILIFRFNRIAQSLNCYFDILMIYC